VSNSLNMAEAFTELTKDEWNNINIGRVGFNRPSSPRILKSRRISFSFQLNAQLNRNPDVTIAEVQFINCIFVDLVDIGDFLCAGNIRFKSCKFESEVKISESINVELEDGCDFLNNLTIRRHVSDAVVSNIKVSGVLSIAGYDGGNLTLENINQGVPILKQRLNLLVKCQSIEIRNCNFDNFEFVGNSRVRGSVIASKNKINKIEVYSVYIGSQFVISKSELVSFVMNETNEPSGSLHFNDNKNKGEVWIAMSSCNYINIARSVAKSMTLTGMNKKDFIVDIVDLQVEEFSFDNIINEGKLGLRQVSISKNGRLVINSSNLGKVDFLLCDFEDSILDFDNSKLTEIFLAETEFPKSVESNGKESHRQAQLAFGQISTAFSKQGDTVRALDYQAREIEAHYKQLKLYDKKLRKVGFTKISLWLNKWSNDFGRNWQRGVLFSIIAGLFFFYLVVLASNEYRFELGFAYDPRVIPSFFRFMNPLRFFELESIFKTGQEKPFLTLNGWSYFFDLLGRVFVAYGFYQTIQAFRKYGRK